MILDARVARALNSIAGTQLATSGWSSTDYLWYCDSLQRWAQRLSSDQQREIRPDELEWLLFDLGGRR
ncbi:8-oxoguanine DNA glycosylase OGG fold protein [Actinomyces mediterranea]|uniref:8-oxoguanine DNA glycosylase OGG fold protein n=1 Tax=Actinomyces mediterranea TaxID=1871028 RepID=UPI0038B2EFDA